MHVALGVVGDVVVQHVADALHVETAGGDVTVSDLVAKGAVRKNEKVKVLGTGEMVPTQLYNGYGEFVADMHTAVL